MDVALKDVEVQALQLPPQQRSELVHSLIASLTGPMADSPEAIKKAWDEEIDRRIADFEAAIDWYRDALAFIQPNSFCSN